jgi:hypothetical protein
MGIWADIKSAYINRHDVVDDYMKFNTGKKVILTSHDKCTLATFYKKKLCILGEDSRMIPVNDRETLKLVINIFIDTIKIYDFNLVEFIKKYKVPNQYFVIGDVKFYMEGKRYYLIADNNEKIGSSESQFFVTILHNLHTNFEFEFEEHEIMTGYIS